MISLVSHRATVLFAILAATVAVALSSLGSASALSLEDYETRLEMAGYKVTPDAAPVDYTGIKQKGTRLVIEKDGKSTSVVILPYQSVADVKLDWDAEAGKAPKPKASSTGFDGKVVYWNNDSVLVVEKGAGIDSSTSSAAAAIFLGRATGNDGTPSPSPTPAPPKTGTDSDGERNTTSFDPLLLLGGVALLAFGASVGAFAHRRVR